MRLMAVLTGVLAMVAIATGCGGGDSERLTKAEFIEQGDAICEQSNNQIRKEYEAFAKSNEVKEAELTNAQGAEIGGQILLPNMQTQAEELRELNPPEADEKQIVKMLDALEAGIAKARDEPKSLIGADYPFAETNELAQKYGFKVCGLG
jgi:hypothetical protein